MTVDKVVKKYVDEYLDECKDWNEKTIMVLLGLKAMYEATKDTYYKERILECMERFIDGYGYTKDLNGIASGRVMAGVRILDFAYQMTLNEKYKKAIEQTVQASVEALYLFPEEFYMTEPSYMLYETIYNKKEGYNRIHNHFKELEAYLLNGVSLNGLGWYMMALIDSFGIISEQIFEQMKYIQKLFKDQLKNILEKNIIWNDQSELVALMISYSIMKSCRLEAISKERYYDVGADIYQTFLRKMEEKELGSVLQDEIFISTFMMAYSEVILKN